jgi:hypothetical protein
MSPYVCVRLYWCLRQFERPSGVWRRLCPAEYSADARLCEGASWSSERRL